MDISVRVLLDMIMIILSMLAFGTGIYLIYLLVKALRLYIRKNY